MADIIHLALTRTVPVDIEISRAELLSAVTNDELLAEAERRGVAGMTPAAVLLGAQVRGARGLLNWSLADLAAASLVSVSTLKRIEDGHEGKPRAAKLGAIRQAFGAAGVRFVDIEGAAAIVRVPAPLAQAAE